MAQQLAAYEEGCEGIVGVPSLRLSKGTNLLTEPKLERALFCVVNYG